MTVRRSRRQGLAAKLGSAIIALAASGGGGCGGDAEPSSAGAPTSMPRDETGWATSVSLVTDLPHCDVFHRGLLFDFGSPGMIGRYGAQVASPLGIVETQHDGATWGRVYDRRVSLRFHLPDPEAVFVSLRAIGHDANRVDVSLDGYLLGTVKLSRKGAAVGRTRTSRFPVDEGLHTLQLRFRGRQRNDANPFAEVDWVRVGVRPDADRTYGPPTFDDIVDLQAALAGVPHRALSLRSPSRVTCPVHVLPGARFRVAVGLDGGETATAAVVVRAEGEAPTVLESVDLQGGEDAAWTQLDLPLDAYEDQIVGLELRAGRGQTGRVLFGDPELVAPDRAPVRVRKAKVVAVVVLSGLERRDLPPWRGVPSPHLPTLGRFAKKETVFDDHRVPSTLVSAVIASLLSGLDPRETALHDLGARLPETVPTLGTLARNASVRSAMFTNVPTTFEPFGFAAAWETFVAHPPNEGAAASAPLDRARAFLTDREGSDDGRPTFAFVHTRGGHPPWDVTPDEAKRLPPGPSYSVRFSPRRAAQQLAALDGRHSRLTEGDRARLEALALAALSRQDRALGELVRALEEAELWDDTLMIVTGDVSSSLRHFYRDGGPLDEEALSVPLYVHFPGGDHGGDRVASPTEVYDVTRTVVGALDMAPRPDMRGRDLAAIAARVTLRQWPRSALRDDTYAVRWGRYVLRGQPERRPTVCDLAVDPTCAYDRTDVHPGITLAMFRRLAHERATGREPPPRQPLTLDAQAAAWLSVWGAYD